MYMVYVFTNNDSEKKMCYGTITICTASNVWNYKFESILLEKKYVSNQLHSQLHFGFSV